ncbi:pyridoxamine 5'-phosphate oxidase family protein [Nocardia puris]|uniref:Pyridoxamine 5'-phosphate oxidase n=1 Tax=Nocardia puris TaxID=208602 RepID=A0A366DJS4_9NOCA|nr:pyridoxamine 5'-phosphate oxidase family protein [Nocardia puris]MBF6213395.1 pyridoxamine 5'-phosphate oxidase family protein [Nocardia puris]MBF6369436.1 pyridoxamine 5'-phosphate oxidase family protein [Nocardia puris]MBF6462275.1 pyridoxamine 5'-phosphate oxidase family protein [Nocardia puris]RBO89584.1 pyridoxamine 5'-phosphate oxidase [Nocardia puris]
MTEWSTFTEEAPKIAEVFLRRHRATGNLCMLGTLRADGSPRISPVEPMIFEGRLVIIGMPDTTKFKDLARDPRFCIHTATVDTTVGDGDAKLFGTVVDDTDTELHARFAQYLFDLSGMDLRGQEFDHFYVGRLTGASCIEAGEDRLTITIWKPGEGERVVYKG